MPKPGVAGADLDLPWPPMEAHHRMIHKSLSSGRVWARHQGGGGGRALCGHAKVIGMKDAGPGFSIGARQPLACVVRTTQGQGSATIRPEVEKARRPASGGLVNLDHYRTEYAPKVWEHPAGQGGGLLGSDRPSSLSPPTVRPAASQPSESHDTSRPTPPQSRPRPTLWPLQCHRS